MGVAEDESPMPRLRSGSLALACLVLLAGCGLAPPTADDRPRTDVRVVVANDHDQPYVVTVGAAPAGHRGFAVELLNGTVKEYPQASGLNDLPDATVSRAVSIRPIGDTVQTRTYRFDADTSQQFVATFENVPRDVAVYFSVASPAGDEPLRSFGSVTCGARAQPVEMAVRIDASGSVTSSSHCLVADDGGGSPLGTPATP